MLLKGEAEGEERIQDVWQRMTSGPRTIGIRSENLQHRRPSPPWASLATWLQNRLPERVGLQHGPVDITWAAHIHIGVPRSESQMQSRFQAPAKAQCGS